MPVGAALTQTLDPTATGSILSFVTPAADGCGMACAYCFIDRRGEETSATLLQPDDYARFIIDAARVQPVAAVTIQGREPLAPSARPWTEAILAAGNAVGAETGLVTNGFWLQECVGLIEAWGCGGVNVSIDSAVPEEHDRMRRAPGAWQRAVTGLRRLSAGRGVTKIAASSLIFPGAARRLSGLARHLEEARVRHWTLSPLLRFGRDGLPRPVAGPAIWSEAIGLLSEEAARHGVTVIADDEFGTQETKFGSAILLRTLSRPGGIMRMAPDGRCTFGADILKDVRGDCVRWLPGQSVGPVVERLLH